MHRPSDIIDSTNGKSYQIQFHEHEFRDGPSSTEIYELEGLYLQFCDTTGNFALQNINRIIKHVCLVESVLLHYHQQATRPVKIGERDTQESADSTDEADSDPNYIPFYKVFTNGASTEIRALAYDILSVQISHEDVYKQRYGPAGTTGATVILNCNINTGELLTWESLIMPNRRNFAEEHVKFLWEQALGHRNQNEEYSKHLSSHASINQFYLTRDTLYILTRLYNTDPGHYMSKSVEKRLRTLDFEWEDNWENNLVVSMPLQEAMFYFNTIAHKSLNRSP